MAFLYKEKDCIYKSIVGNVQIYQIALSKVENSIGETVRLVFENVVKKI